MFACPSLLYNISAGHMPQALHTIMRMSKCLLRSLNLLQNRTRKISAIMKLIHKIIFPIEMIRKRLLLLLFIYATLWRALMTWCWEISRNLIVHPACNILSTMEYYHLYICLFQFHFLCFNLLSLFSLSICLNVSSVSF